MDFLSCICFTNIRKLVEHGVSNSVSDCGQVLKMFYYIVLKCFFFYSKNNDLIEAGSGFDLCMNIILPEQNKNELDPWYTETMKEDIRAT